MLSPSRLSQIERTHYYRIVAFKKFPVDMRVVSFSRVLDCYPAIAEINWPIRFSFV